MRILYSIVLCLLPGIVCAKTTPLQNLLLINDFETWLNGGESVINWKNFRNKDIGIYKDKKVPNQIYYDFKRNIFNAEKEYGGKVINIYGPFNSIERHDNGEPLIVFNLGYVNKLYTTGYTVNEVEDLKIGNQLDLYCADFFMDKFGDMHASCSMQNSLTKFIAVKNIQQESSQPFLEKIIDQVKPIRMIDNAFDTNTLDIVNAKCTPVDSKNYNFCMELIQQRIKK
jgi:hypothetical protein